MFSVIHDKDTSKGIAMTLEMIKLEELEDNAEALFGGKAYGISRLIKAGARTPAGFAAEVTARTPDQWNEEEREAFSKLAAGLADGKKLAVHSSAKGEDSMEQSFAGMFESVLDVDAGTSGSILSAVSTCIASGSAQRVLEYANVESPIPVGVVVQRMVPARAAGVCFTRDPAGKDRAVVIEAVPGLGDGLVSGHPSGWKRPSEFRSICRFEPYPTAPLRGASFNTIFSWD